MLPVKRAVGGEANDDEFVEAAAVNVTLKKPCLVSTATASSAAIDLIFSTNINGIDSANSESMGLGDRNHNGTNNNLNEIDEDLHSRQLAVYGRETMRRLFGSNILVSGLQGLGAEIAKNLILAGVKSVTLHDEGFVELWDMSSNFIFSEEDVGKNRALVSVQKLQELNNSVVVSTLTTELTKEKLSEFQLGELELFRRELLC